MLDYSPIQALILSAQISLFSLAGGAPRAEPLAGEQSVGLSEPKSKSDVEYQLVLLSSAISRVTIPNEARGRVVEAATEARLKLASGEIDLALASVSRALEDVASAGVARGGGVESKESALDSKPTEKLLIKGNRAEMPIMVHIPEHIDRAKPVPILIAIGGAGSDENTFFARYCGDALIRESESRGMIVLCPSLESVLVEPSLMEVALSKLRADNNLTDGPVFLLSYSMGARAAAQLLDRQEFHCTAWVTLAGTGVFPRKELASNGLIIVGGNDHLVDAATLQESIAAKSLGDKIELKVAPDLCHYLIVPFEIKNAIDWLFSYSS